MAMISTGSIDAREKTDVVDFVVPHIMTFEWRASSSSRLSSSGSISLGSPSSGSSSGPFFLGPSSSGLTSPESPSSGWPSPNLSRPGLSSSVSRKKLSDNNIRDRYRGFFYGSISKPRSSIT
ncbi:uncharacterized protein PHACADRAFT_263773 [Phanerochaete carnosa HHB-10118-sp]|uniref:Uncharacterized protein n=1 Tax=Phanerochaete carnosa (strain HHB-10118-sp) TaxID=650164 RepID=K5VUI7_PHACS|nr:uncharacterized protein PHACADRAFT_263773 [Phanerochaete carnosa HHB-10118-sp]EKM50465.1 hypothetical protein PHACADRAFT_263773 [Phanerochaete carnosa HHB-10118-sp]